MQGIFFLKGIITLGLCTVVSSLTSAAPLCTSAAIGVHNGWGWENNASCQVVGATVSSACLDSPPVGDGWGWDGSQSCRVTQSQSSNSSPPGPASSVYPACASVESDPDGDGFGWENSRTCVVGSTETTSGTNSDQSNISNDLTRGVSICLSADSDSDGDGYGWENQRSCVVAVNQATGSGGAPSEESPIGSPLPVETGANVDPLAVDDQSATGAGVPVSIDVLTNDTDPDGDRLTLVAVVQPLNGSAVMEESGVTYSPAAGFFGSDSFVYQISDGNGGVASATVIVTVTDGSILTLRNSFGNPAKVSYLTDGDFAVLWDSTFDHAADAELVGRLINEVRTEVLGLGLQDPSPLADGNFHNTYIHHGADDSFPTQWGNSPLTDDEGNPYLVLWHGAATDINNVYHEAFHVFQPTLPNSAFAPYVSEWYKEASAIWYAAVKAPNERLTFRFSQIISKLPHLALWHGWGEKAAHDPATWSYRVHSFGMSTFLYHLSRFEGVSIDTLLRGYEDANGDSAQQYLIQEVGVGTMRKALVDWAVSNVTGQGEYITTEQKTASMVEIVRQADPDHLHPYAAEVGADSFGTWVQPDAGLAPRGWGFNVIKVVDVQAGDQLQYRFEGNLIGSEGAASRFALRSIVITAGISNSPVVDMQDDVNATGIIDVPDDQSEIYIVVVALPDQLEGHQSYPYSINIDRTN